MILKAMTASAIIVVLIMIISCRSEIVIFGCLHPVSLRTSASYLVMGFIWCRLWLTFSIDIIRRCSIFYTNLGAMFRLSPITSIASILMPCAALLLESMSIWAYISHLTLISNLRTYHRSSLNLDDSSAFDFLTCYLTYGAGVVPT